MRILPFCAIFGGSLLLLNLCNERPLVAPSSERTVITQKDGGKGYADFDVVQRLVTGTANGQPHLHVWINCSPTRMTKKGPVNTSSVNAVFRISDRRYSQAKILSEKEKARKRGESYPPTEQSTSEDKTGRIYWKEGEVIALRTGSANDKKSEPMKEGEVQFGYIDKTTGSTTWRTLKEEHATPLLPSSFCTPDGLVIPPSSESIMEVYKDLPEIAARHIQGQVFSPATVLR